MQYYIETIKYIGRIGSFGAKIIGIILGAVGIKRLFTHEDHQHKPLKTKLALSTSYAVHMGTTTLAASTFLQPDLVSPQVASVLVNTSTLVMNYLHVKDSSAEETVLQETQSNLEADLQESELNFFVTLSLENDLTELDTRQGTLREKQTQLLAYRADMQGTQDVKKWKALFKTLKEEDLKHQDIRDFFESIIVTKENAQSIIQNLRDHTLQPNTSKNKLSQWGARLTHAIKLKKYRDELSSVCEKLDKHPVTPMNTVQIRYLRSKRDDLENALLHHDTKKATFSLERKLLKHFPKGKKLNLFLIQNLDGRIADINDALNSLQDMITSKRELHDFMNKKAETAVQNLSLVNTLKTKKVLNSHKQILENQNKSIRRTRYSFSQIVLVISTLNYLLPPEYTSIYINMGLLGLGLIGGAMSAKDFYNKYALQKKLKSKESSKRKTIRHDTHHRLAQISDETMRDQLLGQIQQLAIPNATEGKVISELIIEETPQAFLPSSIILETATRVLTDPPRNLPRVPFTR